MSQCSIVSHYNTVSSVQVITCYLCVTFIEASSFSCVCFTFRPIKVKLSPLPLAYRKL